MRAANGPTSTVPNPENDLKPKLSPEIKLNLNNYAVIARIRLK